MFATVVCSMIQKLKLNFFNNDSHNSFILMPSLRLGSIGFSPASPDIGSTHLKHAIYQDRFCAPLCAFSNLFFQMFPQHFGFGGSTSRGRYSYPLSEACSSANIYQYWYGRLSL